MPEELRVVVRLACGHGVSFDGDKEAAETSVREGQYIFCTPCQEAFSPFFKALAVEARVAPR